MGISKCSGTHCPIKFMCLRYTCEANPHWQAWDSFSYDHKTCVCDYLIYNDKYKKKK